MVLAIVETQTFFIEKAGGAFLNWRNQDREAWGTTWERQQNTSRAARQIGEDAGEASRIRRQAELVSNFSEILSIVPEGEGVTISPKKFVELYRALPSSMRYSLIDPGELVELFRSETWQRTVVRNTNDGAAAFLIDERNRVLRNIPLSKSYLDAVAAFGKTIPGKLQDLPMFFGKIYSADQFFNIYYALPQADRDSLFPEPDMVLGLPQPVVNVGLAPADEENDYGMVGFESHGLDGIIVTTYPAATTILRRIIWKLVWNKSDTIFTRPLPAPVDSLGKMRSPLM